MGRLGDEGPADEIFETLLRHRLPSISHDTAAFHAKQRCCFSSQAAISDRRSRLATRLVEAAVFSELGWLASVSSGHELYSEELEVDAAPLEFQFGGRCGDWSTFEYPSG